MKKIMILSLLSCVLVSMNCDTNELCTVCLKEIPNGFNFLKSYPIEGQKEKRKTEYSYVLTKGTKYSINVCQVSQDKNILLEVFDSKRNKVLANKVGGELVKAIIYNCNSTGIYYLDYSYMDENKTMCAGSTLSFSR